MKTLIKKTLKAAGFTGKIYFRKHNEFGKDGGPSVPAIHRRLLDLRYDVSDIMHSVERDNFENVVIYLEPDSYYRYQSLLGKAAHKWTEGEINGLRKGLGYCTNWSSVAREEMTEDIQRNGLQGFRITKEQTKFGLAWLKRTQWKLNGELRAGAFIGEREAKIIKNFSYFEFEGLSFQAVNPYTGCAQCIAPIYKVVAKNGDSFSYRVSPMGGFGASYEVVS